MKKSLYTISIALALSFSAFCFLYLNSQEVTITVSTNSAMVSSEVNPEKEGEVYFPDLAVVEKISALLSKMSKVF